MSVGANVRRWRERHKMTQQELADYLGIFPPYVSRLENGHIDPRLSTVLWLSEVLRIPISRLVR